jgi:simple sugar transport system permease protein
VNATLRREALIVTIALLAAVAIGSSFMLFVGKAPGHVWWLMVSRVASDPYALGQVLYKATALALTGLSVSIALDAGLFNIGAEGQVIAGVVACATVGSALPAATPAIIAVPLCTLAAAAAGALVGGAIGALRVWRNAHTVISSIIFNAIVASVALWLGNELLFQNGTTTGPPIIAGAELPQLGFGGSSANAAIVLAVAAVAGVWWIRARTTWGQALIAVGRDPETARAAGISVDRVYLVTMLAAGGLAGLAATNFVLGHKHAFEDGLGSGAGILGISAALLGRGHPIGVAIASLVLGFLSAGGLAVSDQVPKELSELLQGVVVLCVACAAPFGQRVGAAIRKRGAA